MELHTAGHRRGVVCAPHHEAVEAGRSILAEGGNALEAMVAMAAMIAVVYPHMNHLGGDGFWLIRFPNGRAHAIMAPGPAGQDAHPDFYRDYRDDPAARTACRAHRAGRGRRLDAGARSGKGQRRHTAARCSAPSRHRAGPQRLCGIAQPGATDGRQAIRTDVGAGLCRDVSIGRQTAAGRLNADARGIGGNAAAPRPRWPRRFLPRRYRPRDRRRSQAHRQSGHPRGFDALRTLSGRTAANRIAGGDGLQHRCADPGRGLADDPRLVRPLGRDRGGGLRSCPWPGGSDQAGAAHARPRADRSKPSRAHARPLPGAAIHRRRSDEDRSA